MNNLILTGRSTVYGRPVIEARKVEVGLVRVRVGEEVDFVADQKDAETFLRSFNNFFKRIPETRYVRIPRIWAR